jgi:hypothetical protein
MARIHIGNLPATVELTPEETGQIFGAGRRSHCLNFDALEARELLAANFKGALADTLILAEKPRHSHAQMHRLHKVHKVAYSPVNSSIQGLVGQATSTKAKVLPKLQAVNIAANSSVAVEPDGDVVITKADQFKEQYTYHKTAKGWKLIAYNGFGLGGTFLPTNTWVEETWAPDGTHVETFWRQQQHGPPGSSDQIGQLTVEKTKMTLTLYHAAGYPIYNGLLSKNSQDATVTFIVGRTADGGIGTWRQFHVNEPDSSFASDWKNPKAKDIDLTGYYASGWLEFYPSHYVDLQPLQNTWNSAYPGLYKYIDQVGKQEKVGLPIVAEPPGATVESQSKAGVRTETVWNSEHTQSVTFVYGGPDQATLMEQTYGSVVGGNWVATTDHSKAFVSQTATYDKLGGTLLTSDTVRTDADNQNVTFIGTWTSGTNVDNASGYEKASNYLGFSSVTVQYSNGKPVERDGLLQPILGGRYATDTFDSSGTSIVERQISTAKGEPVLETWTSSPTTLTISRNKPFFDIKQDTFKYSLNNKYSDSIFTLVNYSAAFIKPNELFFDNNDGVMSSSYGWRAFTSVDRDSGETNWNYRQKGQSGQEYNAIADPDPQVGVFSDPDLDLDWNKV